MESSPFEFQIRRLPGNESNYLLIRESRQRYFFRELRGNPRAGGVEEGFREREIHGGFFLGEDEVRN